MSRLYVAGLLGLCGLISGCSEKGEEVERLKIMSVIGEVDIDQLGKTLPHEHVLVDFGGAAVSGEDRYDQEDAYDLILPYLSQVRALGCETLFECTPAYLGRDVELLRRLSVNSGVRLVTNTGYYGAIKDRAIPEHAFAESAEEIAARWIAEWKDGIEGTGIRPGFIKTAFDRGEVSEIDLKLFKAAVITHLETGLTIATHTVDNLEAANAALEELKSLGVNPSAWIWVHANRAKEFDDLLEAFEAGAWVEFDGLKNGAAQAHVLQQHVDYVVEAKERGYLSQVLVSHDAGWYRAEEPDGAPDKYRGYNIVFENLIPALEKEGFTREDINQLIRINPAQAYAIRVRKSS